MGLKRPGAEGPEGRLSRWTGRVRISDEIRKCRLIRYCRRLDDPTIAEATPENPTCSPAGRWYRWASNRLQAHPYPEKRWDCMARHSAAVVLNRPSPRSV